MKETHDDLSDLNVTQQESLGEWETQFTRESKHFHVLSKKKKKIYTACLCWVSCSKYSCLLLADKYDYIGKLLKPGEEPTEYTDDEEVKDKKKD